MISAHDIKLKYDMEASRMRRLGIIDDQDDVDDLPQSRAETGPSQAMVQG